MTSQPQPSMERQRSKLNLTRGLTQPARRAVSLHQCGVLAVDGSVSMAGEKEHLAKQNVVQFVHAAAAPANKDAFDIGIVRFADTAEVAIPLQRAVDAARHVSALRLRPAFSLRTLFQGGTNITAGLELAEHMLTRVPPRSEAREVAPLILCFTDGEHNVGPRPEPTADRLKQAGVTLITIAYGKDADERTLRLLASSPQHFVRCTNGSELRVFFAAVAATLSATVPRGINPTHALGRLTQ